MFWKDLQEKGRVDFEIRTWKDKERGERIKGQRNVELRKGGYFGYRI